VPLFVFVGTKKSQNRKKQQKSNNRKATLYSFCTCVLVYLCTCVLVYLCTCVLVYLYFLLHSIHSEQMNTHMDVVWFIGITLLTGILMYFEMELPMQYHRVYDVGHTLVNCSILPDWFFRGSCATTINSLFLCGSITYALMDVYMMGEITTLLTQLIVLFGLRFMVGSCTRLPQPYDFVPHTSDIPPKGCNFFFLFSAHTATITSVGLHVTGKHGAVWWWLFVPILVFQSIRLLSTRGHYTADILLALVLSIFLYI